MLTKITRKYMSAGRVLHRTPPSVQYYARSYNVNTDDVIATGVKGMHTKYDLITFIKQKGLKKVDWFRSPAKYPVKPAPKPHVSIFYIP
jgi:hypothetical protein